MIDAILIELVSINDLKQIGDVLNIVVFGAVTACIVGLWPAS